MSRWMEDSSNSLARMKFVSGMMSAGHARRYVWAGCASLPALPDSCIHPSGDLGRW